MWSRISDFNKKLKPTNTRKVIERKVEYRHSTSAYIKQFEVIEYKDGVTRITFDGTAFTTNEIKCLLKKFFSEEECEITCLDYYIIDLKTRETQEKFILFLNELARNYDKSANFGEIIPEIKRLFLYINSKKNQTNELFLHTIAEDSIPEVSLKNLLKYPKKRSKLYETSFLNDDFKWKKFKKLLIRGNRNLNLPNEVGNTPLRNAVLDMLNPYKLKVIKLLLAFHADPFLRPKSKTWFDSGMDLAKKYNDIAVLNLFNTYLSKPQRLTLEEDKIKIINSDVKNDNGNITSLFQFANTNSLKKIDVTLETKIKNIDELSEDERKTVFAIFQNTFEVPNNNEKLKEIFDHDFNANPNKFIELIYDKNKNSIIGFTLFEFLFLGPKKEQVVYHGVYSLIAPEYRNFGLMFLLAFRVAYSLQLLIDAFKVKVFFCSSHYNSFRLVEKFKNLYPKYQDKKTNQLLDMILDKVFEGNYTLVHDLMTCFILDDLRVKGSYYTRPDTDLGQEFFYEDLLGLKDAKTNTDSTRSVPIIVPIKQDNFSQFSKFALSLGLNYAEHTQKFAHCMETMLQKMLIQNHINKKINKLDDTTHLPTPKFMKIK